MKKHRKGLNNEQIIMLSASGFVIMALTMTGVYVSHKTNEAKDDGYRIDLSALEGNREENENESVIPDELTENNTDVVSGEQIQSDLDADPDFAENLFDLPTDETPVDSGDVEAELEFPATNSEEEIISDGSDTATTDNTEGDVMDTATADDVKEDTQKPVEPEFTTTSTLQWPIVGNVLLNYSMDKTIYFPTLDVYKCNPAIIIDAKVGEPIAAAANSVVLDVFYDEEIGNAVTLNIGSGYELTYGQLDNIAVSEGEGIMAGEIIGYVAEPTKYYTIEGSNVYFKLEKDGTPVNPLSILE